MPSYRVLVIVEALRVYCEVLTIVLGDHRQTIEVVFAERGLHDVSVNPETKHRGLGKVDGTF